MKSRSTAIFAVLFIGLTAAGGGGWMIQRQETSALEGRLELARQEMRELERLRLENGRLQEMQIPVGELERLRADHAALPRLRAEGEALRKAEP